MKRSFLFVLFCSAIIDAHTQNLVINTGFESWQTSNKPYGWTTALSCTKDSSVILSGFYSCKQVTGSSSREIGQSISISPGLSYRLSVWYKNDRAASGNGCRIWSNWLDSEGSSIADEVSLPLLHSGYLKSEIWQEYTADIIAPENASYFNLIIRTLPNSITWWDDVSFEENLPTTANSLINEEISVFPNPVSGQLIISNLNDCFLIEILAVNGNVLESISTRQDESVALNVQHLKTGMYFIRIYNKRGVIIRKIIKSS